MIRYTVKSLVERAFNLADLANTDFISHTEATNYVNDAFKTVYDWFNNNGIKQFVKEVILENAHSFGKYVEYQIPTDLYQVISIKDQYTGHQILRQADSEGINSGNWEIVNDKIRLYGANGANLVMTYYQVPPYLSYPDKDIDVEDNEDILSTAGDSALFGDGRIVNLKTGEQLGSITPSNSLTVKYVLGNGHILTYNYDTSNTIIYYDFAGNVLYTKSGITTFHSALDENYNAYYLLNNKFYLFSKEKYEQLDNSDAIIINSEVLSSPLTYEDITITNLYPTKKFNNKPAFYGKMNDVDYLFTIDEDGELEYAELQNKKPIFIAYTKYGIVGSNGTDVTIESGLPDVELNFTNSEYFTFVAYELALLFLAKQGASNERLSEAYLEAKNSYMNSLDQNSGYTRIRNVYR